MAVNRRNVLRLTTTATGVAFATGLGGAARASGRARTLTLTGKRSSANIPDLLLPGTAYFVHYDLRDEQGQPAGSESAQCTPITVGPDGAMILAALALSLTDGTITASTAYQRPLPALTEVLVAPRTWSHTFAITGGTGAYNGATGEITIDHQSMEDDTLTITLG